MSQRSAPPPVRAGFFYSTCLFLLTFFGSLLGRTFGLTGMVMYQVAFFLGLAVLFAQMMPDRPLKEVLRLRPLRGVDLVKVIALGAVTWLFAQLMSTLTIWVVVKLGGQIPELYQSLREAPFVVALLVGALLPAICEELAFRGYIQSNLQPLGARRAVWITAILFGAMHMTVIRLVPLTFLGLIFASAVQRTRSVWAGSILHFMNNGIALGMAFWSARLPNMPSSPSIGQLGTGEVLLMTAQLLVAGLAVWSLLRSLGPMENTDDERLPNWKWGSLVLPLLPALLIYALSAYGELRLVFFL